MAKSNDKNLTKEELAEKKSNRKGALIFMLIVAIMAPAIWFGLDWLATEYPITQKHITIDGKERVLKFSEKIRGYNSKNSFGEHESGTAHHGYFLELVDSLANKPLHKIKFNTPVHNIQSTPKMYISSNGFIWLVSITNSYRDDEQGFILKFSISRDSIKPLDFTLDEKYGIHDMEENRVMLTDGKGFYNGCNPIFGCVYLDLETEKIIDSRKDLK
ncbi:MAG: hypothetical protein Q8L81_14325 [Bacteroidota bacterium]|nr:hypothetical protein [Bacteroidota bacterium]